MLDQVPRYARRVRWFPGENADVVFEELDERVFLFWIQVDPDEGGLAGVLGVELNFLVLSRLDCLARRFCPGYFEFLCYHFLGF